MQTMPSRWRILIAIVSSIGVLFSIQAPASAAMVRTTDQVGDVNGDHDIRWLKVTHGLRAVEVQAKLHDITDRGGFGGRKMTLWFNLDRDRLPERRVAIWPVGANPGMPDVDERLDRGWDIGPQGNRMPRCERESRVGINRRQNTVNLRIPRYCLAGRKKIRVGVTTWDFEHRNEDWAPAYEGWGRYVSRG